MPFPILTSNAVVQCVHGGVVTLSPKQTSVQIDGGFVMRVGDLVGSPIACPVPPSLGSKPCTLVVADPVNWASPTVTVLGQPVLVQMPAPGGTTDGVPPVPLAGLMCSFAGQTKVVA